MKGYKSNQVVNKMAQIEITGNVIPLPWYHHLRRENGKPYSIAIELLADIVYWYKPIQVRDETTGKLIEYRKKFKADKLQRGYDGFSDMFGYSHEQVKDALKYLEAKGIIELEFRTIESSGGTKLGNVLFIGINPERIIEINTPPMDFNVQRGEEESPEGWTLKSRGVNFKVHTNTETTTKNTQRIKQKESPSGAQPPERSLLTTDLERLESVFSVARKVPLPDWRNDPKGAQKTWRTPLKGIYEQCGNDIGKAEVIVKKAVENMRRDGLTFTKPIQIKEVAESLIADSYLILNGNGHAPQPAQKIILPDGQIVTA